MNSKRLVLGLALLALAVGVAGFGLRSARSVCCVVPKICDEYEPLEICSAFWKRDKNNLCPSAASGFDRCNSGTNTKKEWTYITGDKIVDRDDKDCDGYTNDRFCDGGTLQSTKDLGGSVTWYGEPWGASCP